MIHNIFIFQITGTVFQIYKVVIVNEFLKETGCSMKKNHKFSLHVNTSTDIYSLSSVTKQIFISHLSQHSSKQQETTENVSFCCCCIRCLFPQCTVQNGCHYPCDLQSTPFHTADNYDHYSYLVILIVYHLRLKKCYRKSIIFSMINQSPNIRVVLVHTVLVLLDEQ